MTTEQDMTAVFKDQASEYYLVPLETLKQGHVPTERKAEVERLVAEADEVQGYVGPLILAGALAFSEGLLLGAIATKTILDSKVKPEAPDLTGIPASVDEPGTRVRSR